MLGLVLAVDGQPVVFSENHRSTPFSLVSWVRPRYSVSGRPKTGYVCDLHKPLVSLKVRCLLPGGLTGALAGGDTLSRELRELREVAGLRQVDAAKLAGISQSLIAKFENDRQVPRPNQAETLCRAYRATAQHRRGLVQLAEDLREGTRRVVVHRQHAAIQKQIHRVVENSALVRTFSPLVSLGCSRPRTTSGPCSPPAVR
jgi:transcriptional regulator with XRE-family HTH domain